MHHKISQHPLSNLQPFEITQPYLASFTNIMFNWDDCFKSQYLRLDSERLEVSCLSQEESLLVQPQSLINSQFKSVLGDRALPPGDRYFFAVQFGKGSNFKVGVASRKCSLNVAFSDQAEGWAYYSCGYLRHNSGGDGPIYGETFGGGNVIGVYLDMVEGRLFFSKDGRVFPVAYEGSVLLQTKLYPACSLYLETESFRLLPPVPED